MGAWMLSRVADTVYWMNRYLERVENISRFIEVHLNLVLDLPANLEAQWQPLLLSTGDISIFEENFSEFTRETVIPFMIFDTRNPNAILPCLWKARENARSVRERISTEMWHQINQLYLTINEAKSKDSWSLEDLFLFLEKIKLDCYCIAGMAYHTLSRSEEWQVAKLGRHLERADQLTRILSVKYDTLTVLGKSTASTVDLIQWGAVLRCISGYEMFRREYGILTPLKITSFLLLDRTFPRSLHHNIMRLQEALHLLSGNPIGSYVLPIEKQIGKLKSALDYTDEADIFNEGLHAYLDTKQDELHDIGELLNNYFYGNPHAA